MNEEIYKINKKGEIKIVDTTIRDLERKINILTYDKALLIKAVKQLEKQVKDLQIERIEIANKIAKEAEEEGKKYIQDKPWLENFHLKKEIKELKKSHGKTT